MRFRIYRYNPEDDKDPYMQDYQLDNIESGMMLLDALLLLKEPITFGVLFRSDKGK